jgi:hypothetical protein
MIFETWGSVLGTFPVLKNQIQAPVFSNIDTDKCIAGGRDRTQGTLT